MNVKYAIDVSPFNRLLDLMRLECSTVSNYLINSRLKATHYFYVNFTYALLTCANVEVTNVRIY